MDKNNEYNKENTFHSFDETSLSNDPSFCFDFPPQAPGLLTSQNKQLSVQENGQLIRQLKQENFDLRLHCYHLGQKVRDISISDSEQISQDYILRMQKQHTENVDLLKEANAAIDHLKEENSHLIQQLEDVQTSASKPKPEELKILSEENDQLRSDLEWTKYKLSEQIFLQENASRENAETISKVDQEGLREESETLKQKVIVLEKQLRELEAQPNPEKLCVELDSMKHKYEKSCRAIQGFIGKLDKKDRLIQRLETRLEEFSYVGGPSRSTADSVSQEIDCTVSSLRKESCETVPTQDQASVVFPRLCPNNEVCEQSAPGLGEVSAVFPAMSATITPKSCQIEAHNDLGEHIARIKQLLDDKSEEYEDLLRSQEDLKVSLQKVTRELEETRSQHLLEITDMEQKLIELRDLQQQPQVEDDNDVSKEDFGKQLTLEELSTNQSTAQAEEDAEQSPHELPMTTPVTKAGSDVGDYQLLNSKIDELMKERDQLRVLLTERDKVIREIAESSLHCDKYNSDANLSTADDAQCTNGGLAITVRQMVRMASPGNQVMVRSLCDRLLAVTLISEAGESPLNEVSREEGGVSLVDWESAALGKIEELQREVKERSQVIDTQRRHIADLKKQMDKVGDDSLQLAKSRHRLEDLEAKNSHLAQQLESLEAEKRRLDRSMLEAVLTSTSQGDQDSALWQTDQIKHFHQLIERLYHQLDNVQSVQESFVQSMNRSLSMRESGLDTSLLQQMSNSRLNDTQTGATGVTMGQSMLEASMSLAGLLATPSRAGLSRLGNMTFMEDENMAMFQMLMQKAEDVRAAVLRCTDVCAEINHTFHDQSCQREDTDLEISTDNLDDDDWKTPVGPIDVGISLQSFTADAAPVEKIATNDAEKLVQLEEQISQLIAENERLRGATVVETTDKTTDVCSIVEEEVVGMERCRFQRRMMEIREVNQEISDQLRHKEGKVVARVVGHTRREECEGEEGPTGEEEQRLRAELSAAKDRVETLTEEMTLAENRFAEIREKVGELCAQVDRSDRLLSDKEQELEEVRMTQQLDRLAGIESSLRPWIEAVEEFGLSGVADAVGQLFSISGRLTHLAEEASLEAVRAFAEEMRTCYRRVKAAVRQARTEADVLVVNDQVDSLRIQLVQTRTDLECDKSSLSTEVARLSEDLNSVTSELRTRETEISRLSHEYDELVHDKVAIMSDLAKTLDSRDSLERHMMELRGSLEDLQGERDVAKRGTELLEAQLANERSGREAVQLELSEERAVLENMRVELEEVEKRCSAQLRDQEHDSNVLVENLTSQLSVVEECLRHEKETSASLKIQLNDLQLETQTKSVISPETMRTASKLEKRVADLIEQLEKQKKFSREIKEKLQSRTSRLEQSVNDNSRLKTMLRDNQAQVAKVTEQLTRLEAVILERNLRIQELETSRELVRRASTALHHSMSLTNVTICDDCESLPSLINQSMHVQLRTKEKLDETLRTQLSILEAANESDGQISIVSNGNQLEENAASSVTKYLVDLGPLRQQLEKILTENEELQENLLTRLRTNTCQKACTELQQELCSSRDQTAMWKDRFQQLESYVQQQSRSITDLNVCLERANVSISQLKTELESSKNLTETLKLENSILRESTEQSSTAGSNEVDVLMREIHRLRLQLDKSSACNLKLQKQLTLQTQTIPERDPPSGKKASASGASVLEDWLRSEVDRLGGELQRSKRQNRTLKEKMMKHEARVEDAIVQKLSLTERVLTSARTNLELFYEDAALDVRDRDNHSC